MIRFPEQLKKCRIQTNWSQNQLARKLFVTRQAVSKWEAGDSSPDVKSLVKLSNLFNISLDNLILGHSGQLTAKIKNSDFTYDPNKDKYVRKLGSMNFYEFITCDWWVIIIWTFIIGIFITAVIAILSIIK